MHKFLERYKLLQMTEEEIETPNKLMITKNTELVTQTAHE